MVIDILTFKQFYALLDQRIHMLLDTFLTDPNQGSKSCFALFKLGKGRHSRKLLILGVQCTFIHYCDVGRGQTYQSTGDHWVTIVSTYDIVIL